MAREKAERQRAKADKAYREELGLSTQDFISLKWIETIAAKQGANIDGTRWIIPRVGKFPFLRED